MSYVAPLLITIHSTEDGYYRWELRDGPDGPSHFAGTAPLLERCFEEIIRSQWVLADHLTSDRDPTLCGRSHDALDTAPLAQVQTPPGHALPAQQDIPAAPHQTEPSASFYPHPSRSG